MSDRDADDVSYATHGVPQTVQAVTAFGTEDGRFYVRLRFWDRPDLLFSLADATRIGEIGAAMRTTLDVIRLREAHRAAPPQP